MHFSVVVCLPEPVDYWADLSAALAPFSLYLEVDPFRRYLDAEVFEPYCARYGLDPRDTGVGWAQVAERYNEGRPDDDLMLIDENDGRAYRMSTFNEEGRWDGWYVGNSAYTHFRCREGHENRVIRERERVGDPPRAVPLERCEGGPRDALDLEVMREEAATAAGEELDRWRGVTAGTSAARPWRDYYRHVAGAARRPSRKQRDALEQAKSEYLAQPRIRALEGTEFGGPEHCPVDHYDRPRDEFIARARAAAVPQWAVLRLDGRWLEREDPAPGWIGNRPPTEGTDLRYYAQANAYLDALPGSAWLVDVGCHS